MTSWNFINGWSLKTVRVSCTVVIGLIMTILNQQSYAETEEAPSMEFLEFLGGGVSVDNEFLDPVNYTEIDVDTVAGIQTVNDKTQDNDE